MTHSTGLLDSALDGVEESPLLRLLCILYIMIFWRQRLRLGKYGVEMSKPQK